jgi:hypothetical protein
MTTAPAAGSIDNNNKRGPSATTASSGDAAAEETAKRPRPTHGQQQGVLNEGTAAGSLLERCTWLRLWGLL